MSYKNLKLSPWTSPKGEERIYINTKFCDYRHDLCQADGCWFKADEQGRAVVSFKPAMDGEMRAISLCEVVFYLTDKRCEFSLRMLDLSFAELKDRIAQCQTKSGHFSYVQYEKKFL